MFNTYFYLDQEFNLYLNNPFFKIEKTKIKEKEKKIQHYYGK